MATSRWSEQHHLRAEQYADSRNLAARVRLHQRFSTNKHGWYLWLFDHFHLPPVCRILELGCGTAALWSKNSSRLPQGWQVTLSDSSLGMLLDARHALAASERSFDYAVIDARSISLPDCSFDCVIANHMLYHVPNPGQALAEIQRVLRPRGRLYASTVGRNHLRELTELVAVFDSTITWPNDAAARFGLENGAAQLGRWFSDVKLYRYDDSLRITEAEPFVAYIVSSIRDAKSHFLDHRRIEFRRFVQEQLRAHGAIHVTKESGLFEARRDDVR